MVPEKGHNGRVTRTSEPLVRSDDTLEHLVEEQAALRRVATLVARGVRAEEIFSAVSDEVGRLVGTDSATVIRYDDDGEGICYVGSASKVSAAFPVGVHWKFQEGMASFEVYRTGRSARSGAHLITVDGPIGEIHRRLGIVSAVASPIIVEGRLWGAMAVQGQQPLPPDTEERVEKFTELVAAAIANAESRTALTRLAEEQAALRRVATLVARGVPADETFAAVSDVVGHLIGTDSATVIRFDDDGEGICHVGVASNMADAYPLGAHWKFVDGMASAEVYRTGRSARGGGRDWSKVEGPVGETHHRLGIVSTVASPIVVEGSLWGAVAVQSQRQLPPDTEERVEKFSELVATAIANAESREALAHLADEQAALRRVATLVADGAAPTAVFDAVAAEMDRLLDADHIAMARYETGDEVTVLADRGPSARPVAPGTRVSDEDGSVTALVRDTERPARMDMSIGVPILVDGRVWGVIAASWSGAESPAPETEARMVKFAELLDTAIANADSRDQLAASRARLVAEGDEARRRVVRDLHDGAQQRLVHTILTLKLAQRAFGEKDGKAELLVGEALRHAERGNEELRELAHGIIPSVLSRGGLRAGVDTFAGRLHLPVQVDVPAERFPAAAEASAYFIVAEALTNVVKHSHAERVEVTVSADDQLLRVEVRDDGVGGADPEGHGLVGLGDRAAALGGWLEIESPPSGGTLVMAAIPLPA
jgi:signal transduction histidine kinase